MTSTGSSITELKEHIAEDIGESQALQAQIHQLRQDINDGKIDFNKTMLQGAETKAKQMSKDLARRIDEIEEKRVKDATDREFLQALNARQVVWDRQIMQVREMTDLMFEGRKAAMKAKAAAKPEQKEDKVPAQPETKADEQETVVSQGAEEKEQEQPEELHHIKNPGADADDEAEAPSRFVFSKQDKHEDGAAAIADWPLLYRMLNIDPALDPSIFQARLRKSYNALALKHSPEHLPDDPEAPERWAAITAAYDMLKDPEKKQYYDTHGQGPAELESLDLSKLQI